MRKFFARLIAVILLITFKESYCAVDQILTSNFFSNPAEFGLINNFQLIGGNVFITPTLNFSGSTSLGSGHVQSKVHDDLPYLLLGKRISEKFVIGFNVTPGEYGHLNWPMGSIVEENSTTTKIVYYRFGLQSSYQIFDDLMLGVGVGNEYERVAELDFVIPGKGNQINKMSGNNFFADAGLYYKINSKNNLTIAAYTPINTFGKGTSTLGPVRVNNYSMNITDAAVVYVGLQHLFNEKWTAEGKIYWSGWSIEKNVVFINTTTGSFSNPANWRDVWSLQLTTRYATTQKVAILGSIIYETNPTSLSTNAIGYPLAASGAISVGLDISLIKPLSTQVIYSYGAFLPNSPINNANTKGIVKAQFQAAVLQFTYKT